MLYDCLRSPILWIGIYITGYTIVAIVFNLQRVITQIENKIPKLLIRIFIFLTFIAPLVALPFTKGPKIAIPTSISLILGAIFLGLNFYLKIVSQKEIGLIPALKRKGKVITTGIYSVVRNPLYLSNGLLAIGMAVLFKSLYALIFSIPYTLLYLPIIYFEEKDLLEKYREEYEEYKRKVPWRMIPKIF